MMKKMKASHHSKYLQPLLFLSLSLFIHHLLIASFSCLFFASVFPTQSKTDPFIFYFCNLLPRIIEFCQYCSTLLLFFYFVTSTFAFFPAFMRLTLQFLISSVCIFQIFTSHLTQFFN